MTTLFLFILLSIAVGWLGLTILCALSLAKSADHLYRKLARKNRREHRLGKWLRFHGKI